VGSPAGQHGILLMAVILLIPAIPQSHHAALLRNWACSRNPKKGIAADGICWAVGFTLAAAAWLLSILRNCF